MSHADEDKDLAAALVTLLRLGMGVSQDDIFLSSDGTSIPNGVFFVQHILESLRTTNLTIAVLSASYFGSQFCSAEVGAAQLRRIEGTAKLYTLLVPPAKFADLGGALYGTQSGQILDAGELSKLRDLVTHGMPSHPDTPTWEKARADFLAKAKAIVASKEAIAEIKPQGGLISREPSATYKSKIRLTFGPVSETIEIGPTTWVVSGDSIPLFRPLTALPWQFFDGKAWTPSPDGLTVLQVPKGQPFRTWISPFESITNEEIFDRFLARKIGTLATTITVGVHKVQRNFAF